MTPSETAIFNAAYRVFRELDADDKRVVNSEYNLLWEQGAPDHEALTLALERLVRLHSPTNMADGVAEYEEVLAAQELMEIRS